MITSMCHDASRCVTMRHDVDSGAPLQLHDASESQGAWRMAAEWFAAASAFPALRIAGIAA